MLQPVALDTQRKEGEYLCRTAFARAWAVHYKVHISETRTRLPIRACVPISQTRSRAQAEEGKAIRNVLQDQLVVPPRFLREVKVSKEDEGAYGENPATQFQWNFESGVGAPYNGRHLFDEGEVKVSVVPAEPWLQGTADRVGV